MEVKLNDRQRRFLVYLAAGMRDEDIARQEGMSECKAKTRVNQLIHKLGAHNRTHCLAVALVTGLVKVEDLMGNV